MIHAGSHDDLAMSSGCKTDAHRGRAPGASLSEPMSARDVYWVIMLQVAKERPELELAMR